MKTKLLFILAFILSGNIAVLAQQNTFAPIGAEWYYSMTFNGFRRYTCIKDSISNENGKVYQIIKDEGVSNDYNYTSYQVLFQEDNKVYFLFEGNPYLMYDFNALEGKIYTFYAQANIPDENMNPKKVVLPLKCRIESISELYIENLSYKRFEARLELDDPYLLEMLENGADFPYTYIYNEKIGSDNLFIQQVYGPRPAVYDDNLRCYSDDETNYVSDYWTYWNKPCDYSSTSFIEKKENNQVEILIDKKARMVTVKAPFSDAVVELFNGQGISCLKKQIAGDSENSLNLSGLPNGMYIVVVYNDGVKVYAEEVVL